MIKQYIDKLPKGLVSFLLRAIILIIVWKLAYHLYLKPHRVFDKPLTDLTASTTVDFMRLFFPPNTVSWIGVMPQNNIDFYSVRVIINGRKIIGIADPCNGLELYVLYIGFLFCVPTSIKRFLVFALSGIVAIFVLNTLRCAAMIWVNMHHNQIFDFAHHYLFKLIVYAAIFGGWVWYSKRLTQNEK